VQQQEMKQELILKTAATTTEYALINIIDFYDIYYYLRERFVCISDIYYLSTHLE
jgi:hypothetical protein